MTSYILVALVSAGIGGELGWLLAQRAIFRWHLSKGQTPEAAAENTEEVLQWAWGAPKVSK